MERVDAGRRHVVAWSGAPQTPSPADATTVDAGAPDPQALLEQERQRVLDSATREGHALGLKQADEAIRAAVAKAERQVEELHAADRELLRSLPRVVAEADAGLEAVAVEAAFASLLRLLGEAASQRSLVADTCRLALLEYRQRPVVLRVAVDDVEAVADLADAEAVRVVGDARLAAGQCRLETHKGLYDTSLEVRLEGMKQAFLRGLRAEGAGR
jgi:flagellar biosynthesis/type III secretory pathway protein FliH